MSEYLSHFVKRGSNMEAANHLPSHQHIGIPFSPQTMPCHCHCTWLLRRLASVMSAGSVVLVNDNYNCNW